MTNHHDSEYLRAKKPIAILVDGGFFLKRYRKCYCKGKDHDAKTVAKNMYSMLLKHVEGESLYRILFYDCPPFNKKAHNPITNKAIDFAKTKQANFRIDFHNELKKLRKVALRFGYIKGFDWHIKPRQTKALLKREKEAKDLTEDDVYYDMIQKGVDIKIGLDIASLSYKQLVDRIILISGDSDFVSAAKLARREGIDFILDPMWNPIDPSLHEHIDGLKSTCNRPSQ